MDMLRQTIYFLILICCIGCNEKPVEKNAAPEGKDLSKLISKNPSDPNLYVERAQVYADNQAYAAAIDDLLKAIEINPDEPKYYHKLSDVYLDGYKSKKAIETLEKAHELFPRDIHTLLKMAEDYVILTDFESAMVAVDKIMNIDNQHPEGYFMMGMIYRNINEKERAINAFQSAVEIEPELYDAWILLGQLHQDLGNKVAIEYFNRAIELDSMNINGWHSKAFYLQNNDNISEALQIYRHINSIDRQFEDAYLNAGIIYYTIDSLEQAYEQFNILVNISPASYKGYYFRGLTNKYLGKIDLAREDFNVSLRINSQFEKARTALSNLNKPAE